MAVVTSYGLSPSAGPVFKTITSDADDKVIRVYGNWPDDTVPAGMTEWAAAADAADAALGAAWRDMVQDAQQAFDDRLRASGKLRVLGLTEAEINSLGGIGSSSPPIPAPITNIPPTIPRPS